jgi:hypothetical protein
LIKAVTAAGFEVVRATSFVFLLLPLLLVSRKLPRVSDKEFDPLADLRLPRPINTMLGLVANLERLLIQAGINFPAGGSLLLVARKL